MKLQLLFELRDTFELINRYMYGLTYSSKKLFQNVEFGGFSSYILHV